MVAILRVALVVSKDTLSANILYMHASSAFQTQPRSPLKVSLSAFDHLERLVSVLLLCLLLR